MQKHWHMISKKYCEVFRKTTEICSTKILKSVPKTCREVFCKTTYKCSTKILRGVLQNIQTWSARNRGVFCKSTDRCSANINKCSSELLRSPTFWHKMSNILVNIQGLLLFSVTSWATSLGGQEITRNYWWQNHLQIFDAN